MPTQSAKSKLGAHRRALTLRSVVLLGILFFSSALLAARQETQRLDRALRNLQAEGLELVFSKRLVRPGLRVQKVPTGESLTEQLEQLLAPHGLTTLTTSGGALLIVAKQRDSNAPLVLRGTVLSAHTGAPLNGATVEIIAFRAIGTRDMALDTATTAPPVGLVVATGPAGLFRFQGLPPGIGGPRNQTPK